LETLAVVAYRQPVLRAEVEAIRGVGCGEILRLLLDRDLLRIVGRSEELGRPLWYGTTRRFLQAFGLSHLDELPWAAHLRRKSPTSQPSGDAPNAATESFAPRLSGDSLTCDVEAA
jgi:segregation and condensation protein B